MLVQYKGLSVRAVKGPGIGPLEVDGPTFVIATTPGVSIDGVPLRRLVPRLLPRGSVYLLQCAIGSIALILSHPPIMSFEVGGVRFQA